MTEQTDLQYDRLGEIWSRNGEVIVAEAERGEVARELQLQQGQLVLEKNISYTDL